MYMNRYRRAYVRKRSVRQMALITLGVLVVIAVLGIAGTSDRRDEEQNRELTREIRAYAVERSKAVSAVAVVNGEVQGIPEEGQ